MSMTLYGFFRSGTSYRTRIALNLKGLTYDQVTLDIRSGRHRQPDFLAINPQGLVPALVTEKATLIQSPAILEWLEEVYPDPPLLPKEPLARAHVRALAAIIGCDIHPVNNLRILNALKSRFGADDTVVADWCGTWIKAGFEALEAMLKADGTRGTFCYGGKPSLADAYLIPQVSNAHRFKVNMAPFPLIAQVDAACRALDAFARAAPEKQPDAD